MRILLTLACLLLFCSGCGIDSSSATASNDQSKKQTKPETAESIGTDNESASERYARLQTEFKTDFDDLKEKINATSNEEEKQQIFAEHNPLPKYIDDLISLSRTFPETQSAVSATLEAVSRSKGEQKNQNMRYLIETFPAKLRYDKITQSLFEEAPSAEIESWLKLLIQHAPEGRQRATALMGYTTYIKNLPEYQRAFENNPQLLRKLPAAQQNYLTSQITETQSNDVVAYLNEVKDKYAGMKYLRGRTFDETAERDLYEFENLAIGRQAPEIVGKDLDGIEFKLSDYEGKIIMLDFWGHWCGPCRQMYPEERELVQLLSGTPFVLIGMNSDHSLEFARDAVESEGLSWRHFWNGADGTRGPIAKTWNIDAWPTIYLIDGDGTIRYKDVQGRDLSKALETLLAEAGHNVDLSDIN